MSKVASACTACIRHMHSVSVHSSASKADSSAPQLPSTNVKWCDLLPSAGEQGFPAVLPVQAINSQSSLLCIINVSKALLVKRTIVSFGSNVRYHAIIPKMQLWMSAILGYKHSNFSQLQHQ